MPNISNNVEEPALDITISDDEIKSLGYKVVICSASQKEMLFEQCFKPII